MVNEVSAPLVEIAPEIPQVMMDKLQKSSLLPWKDINKYTNEKNVFERQYANIAGYYYGIAGRIVFDIFTEYKAVVEAFVKHVLRSEDVPGEPLRATLVGEIATGNSQAFMRPLTYRTSANVAYEHTPSTTGAYNLIPTTSGTETATSGQQAWVILGWYEPYARNLIPYDEIQVTISDEESTRRPLYPRNQFSLQGENNVLVIKESTPKFVEPGNTLDVDVQVRTANIKFGLWPLGIEVISADSSRAAGPTS